MGGEHVHGEEPEPVRDEHVHHPKAAPAKRLVVAGCVPQGDKTARELDGLSVVGVTQIDRIVEVVERTMEGHA